MYTLIEVIFFDDRVGPDLSQQLVLRNQMAAMLQQDQECLKSLFRKFALAGLLIDPFYRALIDIKSKITEFEYLPSFQ